MPPRRALPWEATPPTTCAGLGVPRRCSPAVRRARCSILLEREVDVSASGDTFSDPTGAGDSLAAFYSLARTRGGEPEEAIRFAVERVERLYTA